MRFLLLLYLIIHSIGLYPQAAGEWTYMKGTSASNDPGVFGIKGVADINNRPPSLYEPCSWVDKEGNFWMFGGHHGTYGNIKIYNTLWKYSVQDNIWTWISGSNIANNMGQYGTKGVPSTNNCPSARSWGIMCWVDTSNNLWLYGGGDSLQVKQDLWKYSIATNEWTWVSGAKYSADSYTKFGIKGVPSINNAPPPVSENNCTWVDSLNNLWFYGGLQNLGELHDELWRYNIATNEWTWIYGCGGCFNINPIYGIKGIEDINNRPGGRSSYSSFIDEKHNFYFFGSGDVFTDSSYNNIWKYDVHTNMWTWVSGDQEHGSLGSKGNYCEASYNNCPASRGEVRSSWADPCGLWIYGGKGKNGCYSDLWRYQIEDNKWELINGDTTANHYPYYGTALTSNPYTTPGARMGSASWKDKNNNLWLYGGMRYGGGLIYADLWRYIPDPNCSHNCSFIEPLIPDSTGINDTINQNSSLKIPNAFTPNSDGSNDYFKIIAENYSSYQLRVFNRWGEMIFKSDQADKLWNGTSMNNGMECVNGVYFYILILKDYKGKIEEHKGTVTLIR